MTKKKCILLFAGIVFLASFCILPANRKWCQKVASYWTDFQKQKGISDTETRLKERFGKEYIFSKNIASRFGNKAGKENALVLVPPTSYFTKMGIAYHVPEPAVFYYFTGMKTIWANSKDAIKAGWYVRVKEGKIVVDSVTDKKCLQDTIVAFNKMGVSL